MSNSSLICWKVVKLFLPLSHLAAKAVHLLLQVATNTVDMAQQVNLAKNVLKAVNLMKNEECNEENAECNEENYGNIINSLKSKLVPKSILCDSVFSSCSSVNWRSSESRIDAHSTIKSAVNSVVPAQKFTQHKSLSSLSSHKRSVETKVSVCVLLLCSVAMQRFIIFLWLSQIWMVSDVLHCHALLQ